MSRAPVSWAGRRRSLRQIADGGRPRAPSAGSAPSRRTLRRSGGQAEHHLDLRRLAGAVGRPAPPPRRREASGQVADRPQRAVAFRHAPETTVLSHGAHLRRAAISGALSITPPGRWRKAGLGNQRITLHSGAVGTAGPWRGPTSPGRSRRSGDRRHRRCRRHSGRRPVVGPVIAAAVAFPSRGAGADILHLRAVADEGVAAKGVASAPAVKWMPISQPSNQLPVMVLTVGVVEMNTLLRADAVAAVSATSPARAMHVGRARLAGEPARGRQHSAGDAVTCDG